PNVLMKKESIDRGVDFAIGVTESGQVAEGPTENLLILTSDNVLQTPAFDYTLRGTTLLRVLELARAHASQLNIREVTVSHLFKDDVINAREVMMVGTTLGVLPITKVEERPVGDGCVGPIAK